MESKALHIKCLSSMSKVFPNRIVGSVSRECRTLRGQEISFQVAYCLKTENRNLVEYCVKVVSPLSKQISLYTVENVPSMFPVYPASADDGDYITRKPGLFPDPLLPIKSDRVTAIHDTWRAIWVAVKTDDVVVSGTYPIEILFCDSKTDEAVAKAKYCVLVEDYTLPTQRLLFTQWFHCDSIADAHHVRVYSEAHWSLIERYMRLATVWFQPLAPETVFLLRGCRHIFLENPWNTV